MPENPKLKHIPQTIWIYLVLNPYLGLEELFALPSRPPELSRVAITLGWKRTSVEFH